MEKFRSFLSGVHKKLHAHPATTDRRGKLTVDPQGRSKQHSPAWEKLEILLRAQAQAHMMDEGETRGSSLIEAEALDMALRELRSVQRSVLSQLVQQGEIPENVCDELCTRSVTIHTRGISQRECPPGELQEEEEGKER